MQIEDNSGIFKSGKLQKYSCKRLEKGEVEIEKAEVLTDCVVAFATCCASANSVEGK